MAAREVTGRVDGASLRFECPYCAQAYAWSAEQVMNTSGDAIADECRKCGQGFRVLKPRRAHAASIGAVTTSPVTRNTRPPATEAVSSANATASAYQYKVVPFIGRSTGSVSASAVAEQLEAEIVRYASEGWEFCQLSNVNIEVQPGCLAGLFGATTQSVGFDQLIFRSVRR